MLSSQPFLPPFSHIWFTVWLRPSRWALSFPPSGDLVRFAFHLHGAQDGVEGEQEAACILAVGPGRDERTPCVWRQLGRRWRAVSVFERYLGQRTSRSSFGRAIEMLEYDGHRRCAWIRDCLATLSEKWQVIINTSLLSSYTTCEVFGYGLCRIQLVG